MENFSILVHMYFQDFNRNNLSTKPMPHPYPRKGNNWRESRVETEK